MAAKKKAATRKPRKKAQPKAKPGRPTKYTSAMPSALIEHFAEKLHLTEGRSVPILKEAGVDLPTMGSFAREIEVSKRTLTNWAHTYEEFAEAMETANEIQADMLESLTLKGVWVPSMAMFSLKYRHKWEDKVTVDTNSHITLYFDEIDKDA